MHEMYGNPEEAKKQIIQITEEDKKQNIEFLERI